MARERVRSETGCARCSRRKRASAASGSDSGMKGGPASPWRSSNELAAPSPGRVEGAVISDETVERIREAADIVQIIGEHVNLKRSGADFRGPCPFHQGTHRNFSVSPKKGIYYCFVCHEGGDVFTFLQKRLGMEWPAAVRH